MVIAALVICAVAIYARADFQTPSDLAEARAPFAFWILLLSAWSALNLIFVAGRRLYALRWAGASDFCRRAACLPGWPARNIAGRAALSAFRAAWVCSLSGRNRADLRRLRNARYRPSLPRIRPEPVAIIAAAVMTVGLLAKAALFPLHLWLPPAHASAPAAASAVLSALVVKGPFFIAVRLWFDVMPELPSSSASLQLLGRLARRRSLFGSVVALRQGRLEALGRLLDAGADRLSLSYVPVRLRLWLCVPPRWMRLSRRHSCRRFPTPRRKRPCSWRRGMLGAGRGPDSGAFGRGARLASPVSPLPRWFGAAGASLRAALISRRICCSRSFG